MFVHRCNPRCVYLKEIQPDRAKYRGIWGILMHKMIFPSESCNSISKCSFREFRPFSVIAENHWPYVWFLCVRKDIIRNSWSPLTAADRLAEAPVCLSVCLSVCVLVCVCVCGGVCVFVGVCVCVCVRGGTDVRQAAIFGCAGVCVCSPRTHTHTHTSYSLF